jgi:hypothetical protein
MTKERLDEIKASLVKALTQWYDIADGEGQAGEQTLDAALAQLDELCAAVPANVRCC